MGALMKTRYAAQVRRAIPALPVYQPGRPIDLVAREQGLQPDQVVKLASNENPLGPPDGVAEAVAQALAQGHRYPDNAGWQLTQRLAGLLDVDEGQIVLGAGSNELFYLLCELFVEPGVEVVLGAYAFISYRIATLRAGGTPVEVPMPGLTHDLDALLAAITPRTRLVFLPNPNNPTGTRVETDALLRFVEALPEHVVLCYDEAYAEYQEAPADLRPCLARGRKLVITRTFSKIYGLAALRIGYGITDPELAGLLNAVRPPFNTSSLAQAAACAALDAADWVARARTANRDGLEQLARGLKALGLDVVPSHTNFVLVRVPEAAECAAQLQRQGVIVRPVANYRLPEHLRISVGTTAENARLLDALASVLTSSTPALKS